MLLEFLASKSHECFMLAGITFRIHKALSVPLVKCIVYFTDEFPQREMSSD